MKGKKIIFVMMAAMMLLIQTGCAASQQNGTLSNMTDDRTNGEPDQILLDDCEKEVTGQGFETGSGWPCVMAGELVTIPVSFHQLQSGETARVTAEYGTFRLIEHDDSGKAYGRWLEADEAIKDSDTLWWYQSGPVSDGYAVVRSGDVWGHAVIEDGGKITGYAVFILQVPQNGWPEGRIIREVRFENVGQEVTEEQVTEKVDQLIAQYYQEKDIKNCELEICPKANGSFEESKMEAVRYEMVQDLYDMDVNEIEQLSGGLYLLKGEKRYPDIFLSEEQKRKLEEAGWMCGYLNGEKMFSITRKCERFWLRWKDEPEYEIVLRSTQGDHPEMFRLYWEPGEWRVSDPDIAGYPHSFVVLNESFTLTVPEDQRVAVNSAEWGQNGVYMTVREINEIYEQNGHKWSLAGEESIRLRIREEKENLEMEMISLP